MTPVDPNVLLNMVESESFDFKSGQYQFPAGTDEQKAELLKDIIAFANSWKVGDAFIVIGVAETGGRKDQIIGASTSLKDNEVQQFVNSKTNRPVKFLIYTETVGGTTINVIQIARDQQRPIVLKNGFGKLQANTAYIRSGSTTVIATPDQIRDMVIADQKAISGQTVLDLEWAHGTKDQRLGKEATLICIQLTGPPPSPPKPQQSPSSLESGMPGAAVRGFLARVKKQGQVAVNLSQVSIEYGPSLEERMAYAASRAKFAPVRLWIKNLGLRNASSINAMIHIPDMPGVQIVDKRGLPRRPRSSLEMVAASSYEMISDDILVEHGGQGWDIRVSAGTIQPQAEFWTFGRFYMSSEHDQTLQAAATIFADDLARPIEIQLKINVEIRRQQIEAKHLDFSKGDEE